MKKVTLLFVLPMLPLLACSGLGSSAGSSASTAPPAATEQAAPAARPPAPAAAEEGPLNLTEERFQSFVSYRHELHAAMRSYMEDVTKAGHGGDTKGTDLQKAASTFQDLAAAGEKHKGEFEQIRQKYGFTEAEDKRISQAMTSVLTAKWSENPMLQGSVKMFREMQKQQGPAKKAADDFFADLDAKEQKGLAEATTKYGADAVAVLSKHIPELHDLQMEALHSAFGGGSPAPK